MVVIVREHLIIAYLNCIYLCIFPHNVLLQCTIDLGALLLCAVFLEMY